MTLTRPALPDPAWLTALRAVARVCVILSYVLSGAALMLLSLAIFADVFSRNVLGQPIDSTLETVSFWWMVLLVYFGIVTTQSRDAHVNVPLLLNGLDAAWQARARRLGWLLMALYLAAVGWYGFENAVEKAAIGEHSMVSGLPIWPVRFAIPLSVICLLVQLLLNAIEPAGHDETETAKTSEGLE